MGVAEDDSAIRSLVANLARLADTGTVEDYLDAFTADACFEIPERPASNGRAELRERTLAQRAADAVGPSSESMHLLGASEIMIEGDGAVARTPWILCRLSGDRAITLAGRYEDELVRTDEGWRVRHRRLSFG